MKALWILLLIHLAYVIVLAELETNSKDLESNEDLERRHRRRKRPNQQGGGGGGGPCGYGGFGGFGKTFGFHQPDYTYVSAPVMNYFFGCGIAALPVAAPVVPVAPVHPPIPPQQPVFGGFGGHYHHHHHNQQGGGHYGGNFQGGPVRPPPYQGQGYQPQYNRPFNNVVNAAASGFGTALADYIGGTRPKKVYKQVNRQVNQLFKPLYSLF